MTGEAVGTVPHYPTSGAPVSWLVLTLFFFQFGAHERITCQVLARFSHTAGWAFGRVTKRRSPNTVTAKLD